MLSWFSEDATFPFISGMILAVVFFLLFVTSRNKVMLYLSIGIALLVGGLFACEQLIVTDREEIAAVVSDLAVQIEDNNVAGVVKHLSPKHQETINRAKAEMPKYNFASCRLSRIKKFEDAKTNSNAKEITFVVNFRASSAQIREKIPGQREVTLTFEKDANGEWKVINYSHRDPRANVRL